MKKLILALFGFCMCFSISLNPVLAYEQDVEVSKKTQDKIEDMIEVDDGNLVLSNNDINRIEKLIGQQNCDALCNYLDSYNESANEGEIIITDNMTIIDTSDESLSVQSGNVTRKKAYWWGVRNYMSKSKAKQYLNQLNSLKSSCKYFIIIAYALGQYAGFCGQAWVSLGSTIAAFLGKACLGYVKDLRKECNSVYKKLASNQGLIVEFKLWGANRVYKQ